jgi:hypothetical protein
MNEPNVLAMPGSLCGGSHNTALFHAVSKLHPGGLADRPLRRSTAPTCSTR